jgi:hypothetical protein
MASNDRAFTVRIRIGNNEIEISGTHEEVTRTLDDISELVSKVTSAFGNIPTPHHIQVNEQTTQKSEEEFPSITIDPATACPDAIIQILSTDWGKRKPRTLGEQLMAMKVNAIHYPEGTVKGRLTDLTKRGVLRRISSRRGYEYILIKP